MPQSPALREELQRCWNKVARKAGATRLAFVNEIDLEEICEASDPHLYALNEATASPSGQAYMIECNDASVNEMSSRVPKSRGSASSKNPHSDIQDERTWMGRSRNDWDLHYVKVKAIFHRGMLEVFNIITSSTRRDIRVRVEARQWPRRAHN
ncbi:hypothetical protein C8F04DRAFT_1197867 [Mycena alexandri]|uniref:Uncharacterized protein n=1 Tax=Mycena alexandri TaxID=1745969 RepID=A0AAD6S5F2_9AGAR|nr:hypothetical protein C8F04DRAFT_1197867 [Mycena alexandri]